MIICLGGRRLVCSEGKFWFPLKRPLRFREGGERNFQQLLLPRRSFGGLSSIVFQLSDLFIPRNRVGRLSPVSECLHFAWAYPLEPAGARGRSRGAQKQKTTTHVQYTHRHTTHTGEQYIYVSFVGCYIYRGQRGRSAEDRGDSAHTFLARLTFLFLKRR